MYCVVISGSYILYCRFYIAGLSIENCFEFVCLLEEYDFEIGYANTV